jgi:hypothetical protein
MRPVLVLRKTAEEKKQLVAEESLDSSSTLFLDFRHGPHVFTRVYEGECGKRAKV